MEVRWRHVFRLRLAFLFLRICNLWIFFFLLPRALFLLPRVPSRFYTLTLTVSCYLTPRRRLLAAHLRLPLFRDQLRWARLHPRTLAYILLTVVLLQQLLLLVLTVLLLLLLLLLVLTVLLLLLLLLLDVLLLLVLGVLLLLGVQLRIVLLILVIAVLLLLLLCVSSVLLLLLRSCSPRLNLLARLRHRRGAGGGVSRQLVQSVT